jgi:predicted molibdopterin-dependent oxidoreductase YjgC
MGAYATAFPGGVAIDETSAEKLASAWGFEVPSAPGMTTVEWLEAAGRGELDALYCIGGNFLETMPAPERIRGALAQIPLRLHSDIVLTSQMLVDPAETVYLLPARTRYEQEGGGTETTTERRVIFSPEIPGHRIGAAETEWRSLLALAQAARPEQYERVHFADSAAIRAEIERVVPFYEGIAALAKQGDQFQWGGARLFEDRRFATRDGRAQFQPVRPPAPLPPAAPDEFLLATRRGKQFNSMVQRDVDPLTGAARQDVLMSAADAKQQDLVHGDEIVLRNAYGTFRGRVFLADVARGTLQGHWPEVNGLLAPERVDAGGGVPDYNARVRVERAS